MQCKSVEWFLYELQQNWIEMGYAVYSYEYVEIIKCLRQLKIRKTVENEEELRMKNFLLEIQIFRTEWYFSLKRSTFFLTGSYMAKVY